jgi:hypothetical protein
MGGIVRMADDPSKIKFGVEEDAIVIVNSHKVFIGWLIGFP